jgi:hypothetical protein
MPTTPISEGKRELKSNMKKRDSKAEEKLLAKEKKLEKSNDSEKPVSLDDLIPEE